MKTHPTNDQTLIYLERAIARNRLAHALLFIGENTSQMEKTAQQLASALLCTNTEQKTTQPLFTCGSCANCLRIMNANHPNVRSVISETAEIRVDQIRELKAEHRLRAFEEGAHIWMVPKAASLNSHAANALLKTLEEPQAMHYIVLFAPSKASVLPTIVSRCQIVYFPPVKHTSQAPHPLAAHAQKMALQISTMNTDQRLKLAESLTKEKDNLPDMLQAMMQIILKDVDTHPFSKRVLLRRIAYAIEQAQVGLKRHLNTQLVLEQMILHDWPTEAA